MTTACRGPGFFGKVPTHGDFVSRRLPADALVAWDTWLQAALRCSREKLGDCWLETYLTAPVWRFSLAAGVCGSDAWTGVLMPSVDRVGRYFPLTIAAAVPCATPLQDAWYDAVEELAFSALAPGFVLVEFDAALLALDLLNRQEDAVPSDRSLWWRDAADTVTYPGFPPPVAYAGMLTGSSPAPP